MSYSFFDKCRCDGFFKLVFYLLNIASFRFFNHNICHHYYTPKHDKKPMEIGFLSYYPFNSAYLIMFLPAILASYSNLSTKWTISSIDKISL